MNQKELETELEKYKKANSELLTRLKEIKKLIEELIVTAFVISELRNLWRRKFGLPEKNGQLPENGDMN